MDIGKAVYEKLRKERLVEKTVRFSQTIHRTNLKTFLSNHCTSKDKKTTGKSSDKKENRHQMLIIEAARSRGITIEELLQYDLTSSLYLFELHGLMSKSSKSVLMQHLERNT